MNKKNTPFNTKLWSVVCMERGEQRRKNVYSGVVRPTVIVTQVKSPHRIGHFRYSIKVHIRKHFCKIYNNVLIVSEILSKDHLYLYVCCIH